MDDEEEAIVERNEEEKTGKEKAKSRTLLKRKTEKSES